MAAGGISLHAVDVAHGRTAEGLAVSLYRLDGGEKLVASGLIAGNGQFDDPTVRGIGVSAGAWEARFAIGDYFRAQGVTGSFLDVVPFRFMIVDDSQHYHLPLKFTPFGYSLFRGA